MQSQNFTRESVLTFNNKLNERDINSSHHKGRISAQVQLILCNCCYWSASFFYGDVLMMCPICGSTSLDSIQVCPNETYRTNYSSLRGFTVEFTTLKEN
jgi:hypothetical protein